MLPVSQFGLWILLVLMLEVQAAHRVGLITMRNDFEKLEDGSTFTDITKSVTT